MPRRVGNLEQEMKKATLTSAGIRWLTKASVAPTTGTNASYTMTHKSAKRLLMYCPGATVDTDIRINYGGAAVATDIPLGKLRVTIDAGPGDVIGFFNNNAGTLTVFLVEMD